MANTYKNDRYNIPQFPSGAIIPDEGVDYTSPTRSAPTRYEDGLTIMTLTEGDVVVTHFNGTQVTYPDAPAYLIIPGRVRSVDAGTVADVVAYV